MITAIREVMVGPQASRPALSRRPAWRSVHEPADPRAVWTERIALAPSPTAAATRFIDPDRTSPIAKTSGWLVSNGSGRRPSSAQVAPGNAPSSWVPVSTKPSSSTAMSSSQPVAGVAPTKQNRPRHGWSLSDRSSPGAAVCTVMASRWPPPCSAVTSVAVRTGYPGMSQDAVGEVGGHAGGQVIAAHDQGDGVAASGEIQRPLAGGVRHAEDRDRARTAGRGLQLRRREIDARARELRPPVEWQGSVAGAGGDDYCSRLDSGVVGQHDPQTLVGGVQPGSLAGACDTGAEFLCLHRGAAG